MSENQKIIIAVVIASFNRKDTTLRCLSGLFAQVNTEIGLKVFLLDDNSTDGTPEEITKAYPEVFLLKGTGDLYWGGGMFVSMSEAIRHEFDFMLWLNDDVDLEPNAIELALQASSVANSINNDGYNIIVGPVSDPATGLINYSGFNRVSPINPSQIRRVDPVQGCVVPADTMNGNFVLVPKQVVLKVGLIDPIMVHQLGDIDYGYRANRVGVKIFVGSAKVGNCETNQRKPLWTRKDIGLNRRLMALISPLGLPLRPWITFMWRHGGPVALAVLILIYVRQLFLTLFSVRAT